MPEVAHAAPVQSHLIRERDVLALYADFGPVVQDMELHLLACGIQYDPLVRQLLGDTLAALGLHLASRPIDEVVAWTIGIREPKLALFATGNSRDGTLVGRAFTDEEELAERSESLLVCQSKREFRERSDSYVAVEGVDVFGMVETYYRQSEQKLARFFHREPRVAFLQALPDADHGWIDGAEADDVFALPGSPRVEPLATRSFRFHCGWCTKERVLGQLTGIYGATPEPLFEGDDAVLVDCRRCGAPFRVTRDDYARSLEDGADTR